MLARRICHDLEQSLCEADITFAVEHICVRKRAEKEPLANHVNLEAPGNKALFEKHMNIRTADYRFVDKKNCYLCFEGGEGKRREGMLNAELRCMTSGRDDYGEIDTEARIDKIIYIFVEHLDENGLLKAEGCR